MTFSRRPEDVLKTSVSAGNLVGNLIGGGGGEGEQSRISQITQENTGAGVSF